MKRAEMNELIERVRKLEERAHTHASFDVGEITSLAEEERETEIKIEPDTRTDNSPHCSFCGKGQREVKKLIAGPVVYICNECVKLCQDILDEEK